VVKNTIFIDSFHQKSSSVHDLLRKSIIGGLVNVYSRYTELREDVAAPRNAVFAPNGDRFTQIQFLDFNALYLHAQRQKLPTTPGFSRLIQRSLIYFSGIHWKKDGDKMFRKSIMSVGNSLAALQWLTFTDEFSPILLGSDGKRVPLEHQYFRGEHKIEGYNIDGYAQVDGVNHFFEFLGCFYHKFCNDCHPDETDEAWEVKYEFLKSKGTVHVMRECEWNLRRKLHIMKKSRYWCQIFRWKQSEQEIINGIRKERLYGFIVADVECPKKVYDEIAYLNFPPVIQKMVLTEDHLSPYMKDRYEKCGRSVYNGQSVVQTFNGSGLLLLTPLAKFYMDLGMKIKNVQEFIQYRGELCLTDYVETITKGRVNAIKNKNSALALAFKTIGNCGGFGKTIEQVDRPVTKYLDDKQLERATRKPTFKTADPLSQTNGDYELSEVTMEKMKIADNKPTVLGVAILQHSKLHFLKFVYLFLHKYLKPGSYKLNYADTDSLAICKFAFAPSLFILVALTKSLEPGETRRSKMMAAFSPLIRDDMHDKFFAEWDKWLVLEDTVENSKEPGLLKSRYLSW
jgi:hypothetical protein